MGHLTSYAEGMKSATKNKQQRSHGKICTKSQSEGGLDGIHLVKPQDLWIDIEEGGEA